ncbi:MAG: hypothetical protein UR66_C0005G0001 [Candidatus Moranbacteria bacterium GW2011_GWE1_35_17]|nr:MAG: hypothetical protein UR66_C0005G0001 [Candidatus Moranbacteria bacterium GW2011_GWE1_35_17]KKP81565.1 MAG: hypothetical protein UR82_C0057G0001 [Candidatus Moranbacteria bacterium GW2011_GWF1_35_5]KKP83870.1 MAG: hypothetical protein UR83_C0032G0015 [Candidatus Moranbacteria bacterium GW2011_GWF2_35_54]
MFKKIFFVIFIVSFFLLFVFIGAVIILSQQKNISIKEELKTDSKNIILQIRDIIYFEATKHNPPGDMLPDNLDDKIKHEIKERI